MLSRHGFSGFDARTSPSTGRLTHEGGEHGSGAEGQSADRDKQAAPADTRRWVRGQRGICARLGAWMPARIPARIFGSLYLFAQVLLSFGGVRSRTRLLPR